MDMKSRRRRKLRLLSPKESKSKEIKTLITKFNFWFEEAISPRLDDLDIEINELKERVRDIEQEITEYEESNDVYDEDGRPLDTYLDLHSDIGGLYAGIDLLLMQQLSIEEMKVVCLYKEFEILLKEIITFSLQNIDIDRIYKWEQIKSILNNYGINVGNIESHNRINELRIINNNIKHSNIINEKVIKTDIVEFEGKEKFDSESLSKFYSRMRNEPIKFLESLVTKIIEYLFVFDAERIESIASQYENRMDKETAVKLSELLIKKCS